MANYHDKWAERYTREGGRFRDSWRDSLCEQIVLRREQVDVKRLKLLQMSDHPGVQPVIDYWLDEKQCLLIHDAIEGTPIGSGEPREFMLQYLSIIVYGRSLTPSLQLTGLHEHLRVISGSGTHSRLQLCGSAHARIIEPTETIKSEAEVLEDVASFAKELGVTLPANCGTLNKLRTALKNAQLH